MAIVLPIFVTMLLGSSIDLRTYRISSNVFSDEIYQETEPVVPGALMKTYKFADSSMLKSIRFPADLALHIKAETVDIDGGLNGYKGLLQDSIREENTLQILITAMYATVYRELAEGLKPLENGIKAARAANSTHYVKGVQYGGWFALVHHLKTDHPKDMKKVRQEVLSALGREHEVDEKFFDSWRSLSQKLETLELRGRVHQEYKLYSSLPLDERYLEPQSLIKNVNKFPDEVRKRGGGYGDAMWMTLEPLNDVDPSFDRVSSSIDHENELFKLNNLFDDLKDTQSLLLAWTSTLSVDLTKEQEDHISKLLEDVNAALQLFATIIPEISKYKDIDEGLLEKAFRAYEDTLPMEGGTYHLAYRRLKESIDAVCQDVFNNRVLGQLKLDQDEMIGPIETSQGLRECQEKCLQESRCRAIAFGDKLSNLNRETGTWEVQKNVCWIHFRSTGTTAFESSSEWIGDVYVHDRKCA